MLVQLDSSLAQPPTAAGTLDDVTFAIAPNVSTDQPLVAALLANGAALVGSCDDLAQAVAQQQVDCAVGIDAAGSLRKLAAASNVFALRTSVAEGFDAPGFVAGDVDIFQKLVSGLLPASSWHSLQLIGKPAPAQQAQLAEALTQLRQGPNDAAAAVQAAWQTKLNHDLKKAVMPLPTVADNAEDSACLLALAELARCPQVTIPTDEGSRSFIGPNASDAALAAYAIHRVLVHTGDC
ncbi:hypothetical protein [Lacticaseibacillus jixiensis]|uniref:hypothetical protein n=1 Tax=Lacticaseibacillus jixiensis TaxID=3231926 RepID=UPI0036F1D018